MVAFRDGAGVPVGCGVLVTPTIVLTCAHVVNAALGLPNDSPDCPTRTVRVDWRNAGAGAAAGARPSVQAGVGKWLPLHDGDLARLDLPAPAPVAPARLAPPAAEAAALAGRPPTGMRAYGYPAGRPRGQHTKVHVAGPVEDGWWQLDTAEAMSPDVRRGYSGGPVSDPANGEVYALIAEAPQGGTAHDCVAIPANLLRAFLGESLDQPTGRGPTAGSRPYRPAAELTVLHLSDLHFGPGHDAGPAQDAGPGHDAGPGRSGSTAADGVHDTLLARLCDDLGKMSDAHGVRPDLVVISGDLTQCGTPAELEQATAFLTGLAEATRTPRHRIAVIPGNHDLSRKAAAAYCLNEESYGREPVRPYAPKWRNFQAAFEEFYAGAADEPGGPDTPPVFQAQPRPWTWFEMPDLGVAVAGLNSTVADSHLPDDHYGYLGEDQLAWFAEQASAARGDGWLVIGAVHHNPVRPATGGEDGLRDAEDLDRLLGHRVAGYPETGPGPLHLLLHGHTHDGRLHRLPSGLLALATGTAGARASDRPGELPRQYQLITIRHDGLTCHARAYLPERKTWTGDTRADPVNDRWQVAVAVPVPARAALSAPVGQQPPPRKGVPDPVRDAFLDEVAEVARLRHLNATIIPYPSTRPGASHLAVRTVDAYGPVDSWPVGAVDGALDGDVLDRFLTVVHRPQRAMDPHVRSHLVYTGPEPAAGVRATARREGVALHSLVEYRGLIDLARVRDRQRARLDADDRYPAALYVPQRFRQDHPVLARDDDGRPVVEEDVFARMVRWLAEPGARFVTVLGDFGRGKTFLMHELARRLPAEVGSVEPLLIELRTLEKGPSLHDLVAQHLTRLDVGDVTVAKVTHMIAHGRVAVLLDGYDELVQKVTYDTADAYLATLLAAATDDAKIVLTSRSQHFRDDSQARRALLGAGNGRDAARIVALEGFSVPQIRAFLTHLYGGDTARAERRFTRIERIHDLLGLSANPRMLSFIAELPDHRLDEAEDNDQTISAAALYRVILDHWLGGEVTRQQHRYGLRPLPETARLDACRALALRQWADRTPVTAAGLAGLADTLTNLHRLGFSADQAGHTIGSGSLLTRCGDGFEFIHSSVLEWLVADTAAEALIAGADPAPLRQATMSELMTDFLCDLAGHDRASGWADAVLAATTTHRTDSVAKANAALVRSRLSRRTIEAGDSSASAYALGAFADPAVPIDLTGQDLRDRDVAALAAGGGLRNAVLRNTVWTGLTLTGLDLSGADLTGADLRDIRATDLDLRDARLAGADLTDARLTATELTGADLTGSTWTGSAVLGGHHSHGLARSEAWKAAAVVGRDRAEAVLPATGTVTAVAYLPGHRLLAVARGRTVELVSMTTRRTIRVLTGHTGSVRSVCAVPLPDGRTLLATGSHDGTVRLWDPATGAPPGQPLTGHTGSVWPVCAVPLPDGRTLLATGSDDRTVRLWDPATGAPLGDPLTGHTDSVWSVCAVPLPDGRTLLATGSDDGTVRLWDPATGAPLGDPLTGHTGSVRSVCAVPLPDGRTLLATGSHDGTVRLWDPATGAPLGDPLTGHTDWVRSVCAVPLPDGRTLLATGSDDRTVRLWDPATGAPPGQPLTGHTGSVLSVCAVPLPDGRTLLATGSHDGTVRLWDPATGAPLGDPLTGHTGSVLSVCAVPLPDGRTLLATGSDDRTVRLWDPATGAPPGQPLTGHTDWVRSVCAVPLPDGRTLLATGSDDGTVRLWDPATGAPPGQPLTGHTDWVRSVCAVPLPDGRTLLATGSDDRTVRLWDPATGAPLGDPLTGHTGRVWSVCAVPLPDGRTQLATGDSVGSVRLWDPATGAPLGQPLTGHVGAILAVSAVPTPGGRTVLATGASDRTVRLWDPATGAPLGKPLTGHVGAVLAVSAVPTPGGRTVLAAGSHDRTVRLWDPATGAPLGEPLTGHTGRVWSVCAVPLPDGRTLLATGSHDRTVRLWRLVHSVPERSAPALRPAAPPRTLRRRIAALFDGSSADVTDPPPPLVPVPNVRAEHLATLTAGTDGWAALLADGHSYKAGGDVSELLWWAIKTVRFEPGELDPYDPHIRRLEPAASIL